MLTITGSSFPIKFFCVPLVEQELLTLLELLSSPPFLSGVRVIRSLVLCVCFVVCPFVLFLLAIVLSVLLDKHGFCSLGPSVDCTRAAIQNAKYIIGMLT
jgi:hypothetical protein